MAKNSILVLLSLLIGAKNGEREEGRGRVGGRKKNKSGGDGWTNVKANTSLLDVAAKGQSEDLLIGKLQKYNDRDRNFWQDARKFGQQTEGNGNMQYFPTKLKDWLLERNYITTCGDSRDKKYTGLKHFLRVERIKSEEYMWLVYYAVRKCRIDEIFNKFGTVSAFDGHWIAIQSTIDQIMGFFKDPKGKLSDAGQVIAAELKWALAYRLQTEHPNNVPKLISETPLPQYWAIQKNLRNDRIHKDKKDSEKYRSDSDLTYYRMKFGDGVKPLDVRRKNDRGYILELEEHFFAKVNSLKAYVELNSHNKNPDKKEWFEKSIPETYEYYKRHVQRNSNEKDEDEDEDEEFYDAQEQLGEEEDEEFYDAQEQLGEEED